MSEANDPKTREQLLAEIEALKQKLEQKDSAPEQSPPKGASAAGASVAGASAPIFAAPTTRRQALVNWVAPVILSLPTAVAVLNSRPASAARCIAATSAPTPAAAPDDDTA